LTRDNTAGLLDRRPIQSSPALTELTGKEGNQLAERLSGQVHDATEYRSYYGNRTDPWHELYLPILRVIGAAQIVDRTGVSSSAVYKALTGTEPRRETRLRYQALAIDHARESLDVWGVEAPQTAASTAALFLREHRQRGDDVRRCRWCGHPLPVNARADARYHNDACRRAATRARQARS